MDIVFAIPSLPLRHLLSPPSLLDNESTINHVADSRYTNSATDQHTAPLPNRPEITARIPNLPLCMEVLPPFQPIHVLGVLRDAHGAAIDPDIIGSLDKGFFRADDEWTCYRRNYFSCTCSYGFKGGDGASYQDPSPPMTFVPAGSQTRHTVFGYAMALSAYVADEDGQAICLVQHTPKRERGPVSEPGKARLSPRRAGEFSTRQASIDRRRTQDAGAPFPTQHVFERVQFKHATANNGRRRGLQQYYHVRLELWADVGGLPSERWTMIAYRSSPRLVVRGRSPGNYAAERQGGHESRTKISASETLSCGQSLVISASSPFVQNGAMTGHYAFPIPENPYRPSKSQQDAYFDFDAGMFFQLTLNYKEPSTSRSLKMPGVKKEEDGQPDENLRRYNLSLLSDAKDSISRTCDSLGDLGIVGASVHCMSTSSRQKSPSPVRCIGDCKRQVIDSVLGALLPLLERKYAAWQNGSGRGCTDGSEDNGTSSSTTSSERTSRQANLNRNGGGTGRGGRKRKIDQASDGSPGDDSNDPWDDGNDKRGIIERLRFACPFFKHDPVSFRSSRACCGPGWESVHRMK